MEYFLDLIKEPFIWGFLLGLLLTFFVWKSGFSARRTLKKEIIRIQHESKDLQNHLNTHLKVQAEGSGNLQTKLDSMRDQNETLRVNIANLQQKPGKSELRHLHIVENAVGIMREQAPGFAQAWEKALRQAESDHADAEGGLKRLVRKVLPAIGTTTPMQEVDLQEKS